MRISIVVMVVGVALTTSSLQPAHGAKKGKAGSGVTLPDGVSSYALTPDAATLVAVFSKKTRVDLSEIPADARKFAPEFRYSTHLVRFPFDGRLGEMSDMGTTHAGDAHPAFADGGALLVTDRYGKEVHVRTFPDLEPAWSTRADAGLSWASSPASPHVAVLHRDASPRIEIVEIPSGTVIATHREEVGKDDPLHFSPDGEHLAFGGRVWSWKSGDVKELPGGAIRFSVDGSRVLAADAAGVSVMSWPAAEELATLELDPGRCEEVVFVSFYKKGTAVLLQCGTGGDSGEVYTWAMKGPKKLFKKGRIELLTLVPELDMALIDDLRAGRVYFTRIR